MSPGISESEAIIPYPFSGRGASLGAANASLPEYTDFGFGGRVAVASTARAVDVPPSDAELIDARAAVGGLVLCEVVRLGAYRKLEALTGKEVPLREGDRFVGVFAHRYSTHSLYGAVPVGEAVPSDEPYDLLAVGGIIGRCTSWPSYLGAPTKVRVLGAVALNGDALNTRTRTAAFSAADVGTGSRVVLVSGTAAEVGKTTFASNLTHYLAETRGYRVGVAKLAGTGRLRDLFSMAAAGAIAGLDFVDGGLPTTYDIGGEVTTGVARGILKRLASHGAEWIVAECGGDTLGAHVDAILADRAIQDCTVGLVVIPSDAVAAYGARCLLADVGYPHDPWFGVPIKNVSAARWRARRLFGDRMIDGRRLEDLKRLEEALTE